MSRLDAYVLRQILGPFAFFVLVFTGVIWLSQSLRVIETVVNNGQSALVFVEFTALLLPKVMTVVLPVAGFAATLYAANRLYGDNELTVMFAAGRSGLALLRPVAVFGLGLLALLWAISLVAVPYAQREMRDRIAEVRGDVAAAFLREGAFITPTDAVTVFVREIDAAGALKGVFIHDARDEGRVATYTAERAVLLAEGGATTLVMFDGVAQFDAPERPDTLSLLRFAQLGYDLAALNDGTEDRTRKPSEMFVDDLLAIDEDEAVARLRPLGEFRAEAHEAISGPLYALTLPALGLAVVLSAGYRRQGFLGRVLGAVGLAVALRLAGLAAKGATAGAASLWPTLYLPPIIGLGLALWLLSGPGIAPRRGLAAGGER
ncbi:MAG: LPS export ABC transporter permease LptF [Paracoccaceae bacterium]